MSWTNLTLAIYLSCLCFCLCAGFSEQVVLIPCCIMMLTTIQSSYYGRTIFLQMLRLTCQIVFISTIFYFLLR